MQKTKTIKDVLEFLYKQGQSSLADVVLEQIKYPKQTVTTYPHIKFTPKPYLTKGGSTITFSPDQLKIGSTVRWTTTGTFPTQITHLY